MDEKKIFVVDDELNIRSTLKEMLEGEGYQVLCFENPLKGLSAIDKENPGLVITDLVMPEMDGTKLIQEIKSKNPEINILVITAHASLESAISAIRLGASDYLIKPFKVSELLESVQKALSQKRLVTNNAIKSSAYLSRYEFKNLIGDTPEIKEIHKLVSKVAKTDSSVLIIGESGTGKEMVARTIHFHSKRSDGPFVSINCAALPENLLESELFGHEKGAFTGAASSKIGLFELAENGTFLLDEIGDMPLNLQVKLLRVLQERVLRRVGGIRDIPVNFRLIAATSKNLSEEIKTGRFREELFYRLNVIPIFIPPLRNRKEDIPLFVQYFLDSICEKQKIASKFKISPKAIASFQNYEWPGNVRELENVVERLITLADTDVIDVDTVEKSIKTGHFSYSPAESIKLETNLKGSLDSLERDLIIKTLKEENGNQNKAAKKLQLTRQALHYKLKKLNIKADKIKDEN